MKNGLMFGTGAAFAGALLTFVLYFMGAHNDVAKMQATNGVAGLLIFLVIPVTALVLALRAERTSAAEEGMSYGKGVLTALFVGLATAVFGAIFNYIYGAFINPSMYETLHEMQVAAMEAQGTMTQEQIDQTAAMVNKFSTPVFSAIGYVIMMVPLYLVIGLIVAIFFRRAPVAVPPPPPESATTF